MSQIYDSCHTYEWVVSRTYEWVTSHIWMRAPVPQLGYRRVTLFDVNGHVTDIWVMSQIWMSRVTHIWMSHVTHINVCTCAATWLPARDIVWCKWSCHRYMSHVTHMNESCHTRINESYHTHMITRTCAATWLPAREIAECKLSCAVWPPPSQNTRAPMWHDSFICVMRSIRMSRDSFMRHDSFICDMTHPVLRYRVAKTHWMP